MTSTLDWKFREHMSDMREPGPGRDTRLAVLINLILHGDNRNRTWVGEELIAEEIGVNPARVSEAIGWLFERGAIYNVPYQFRIGVEAELEPRKHVYQLTGLILLGGETVPYLYGDDESRANMLDELIRIGGAHVVELLFSQCAESAHAESAHKDSTVLQGSTALEESTKAKSHRPVSSPPPTPRRKIARNGFQPSAEELRKRSESEKPVDNPEDIPTTDHTELERFILSVVSKTIKRVADTYRKVFDEKVVWYHEGKRYDSPSPNELWNTNPDYQRFVLESVIPSIQKKGRLTPASITSWLSGAGTYQWFFIDRKPGEAKTPQDVKAVEDAAQQAAPCGYESKPKKARVMSPACPTIHI